MRKTFFTKKMFFQKSCTLNLFLTYRTMIPIYLDQVPAGSSTRPFVHYAQLNQLERQFRMFDFGSEELNIENYGQPVPPNHNLKNVQVY